MRGWRERAADIFAKHGEIESKMKFAPEPRIPKGVGTSSHFVAVCPIHV